VAKFEVPSRHFPGRAEGTHKKATISGFAVESRTRRLSNTSHKRQLLRQFARYHAYLKSINVVSYCTVVFPQVSDD
jgi:hypothetical protein